MSALLLLDRWSLQAIELSGLHPLDGFGTILVLLRLDRSLFAWLHIIREFTIVKQVLVLKKSPSDVTYVVISVSLAGNAGIPNLGHVLMGEVLRDAVLHRIINRKGHAHICE